MVKMGVHLTNCSERADYEWLGGSEAVCAARIHGTRGNVPPCRFVTAAGLIELVSCRTR